MIGEGTYANPEEQGSRLNALIQSTNAVVFETEVCFDGEVVQLGKRSKLLNSNRTHQTTEYVVKRWCLYCKVTPLTSSRKL